jgi:hypothetical protein
MLDLRRPVDWECVKNGEVSVQELKDLIKKDWREHEDVWQARELDALERMLDGAITHEAVMRIFGG